MNICVVNASNPITPQGNDSYVDFRNYSSWQDGKWRSWHSLACSQGTEFFAYNGENFHEVYKYDGVIVLFNSSPDRLIPFVRKLAMMGKLVLVGYHEGGEDFILKASSLNPGFLDSIRSLCREAHGYLNVIPSLNNFYENLLRVKSHPTLHAVPYHEWDHKISNDNPSGILVATRTFNQRIRRNTVVGLSLAFDILPDQEKITFIGEDISYHDSNHFPFPLERINIIKGHFGYTSWLKIISQHKAVVHYDMSHTLGQVATDAALVNVPCFGGNSENNQVANTTSGPCLDESIWEKTNDSISKLKARTSFEAVRNNLNQIFENLKR